MKYIYIIIVGIILTVLVSGIAPLSNVNAQVAVCIPENITSVRLGAQSEEVRNFQLCLMHLGYGIPAGATGYFGGQTRAAIQQFYRNYFSLEHEGDYIGPQGLARVKGILSTGTVVSDEFQPVPPLPPATSSGVCIPDRLATVRMGQHGEPVKNFQTCLMQFGYGIPAGATGYFGAQTRNAVKEFYQAVFNLKHEGNYIGPQGLGLMKNYARADAFGTGEGLRRVGSAEELRLYLSRASVVSKSFGGDVRVMALEGGLAVPPPQAAPQAVDSSGAAARISDTNVQVAGIDEPDIVKTDGKNIYFSRESYYYGRPIPLILEPEIDERMIAPAPYYEPKTSVIKAFPPSELSALTTIPAQGDLLLLRDKKILTIFGGRDIRVYDVANPANPEKKWTLKLDENTHVLTSRLANGKIYVITRRYLDYNDPCLWSWTMESNYPGPAIPIIFPCTDLYRPSRIIPVDSTFTAFVLNPETGAVENKISFVGSSQDSVVYMSANALYITYFYPESTANVWIRAVKEQGGGLFPEDVVGRIRNLENIDISDEAQLTEIQTIIDRHLNLLPRDERLRVENEWQNRLATYFKTHRREIEKTSIVKIPLSTFAISHTGSVPGYPLNQFALDEYNGNLRVAVTIGQRWWGWGWGGFWPGNQESANDVYVLDGNMQTIGSVPDLGLTERIFAARFIGPRAYLVTFRQIDPFYVLDLSDPRNPQVKGELKIPGFSSYLEPISDSLILGVGQEGSNVKLSLFDASNPSNPVEKDKYTLADSWTEVNSNHRAFLKDDTYRVFFLPGSQGGYIFSYEDGKLSLKKAVSGYAVKRGLFLDDYFYVIGEDRITVFDEKTWEEVKKLELKL